MVKQIHTKKELIEEYIRCSTDPAYCIETYLETLDGTQGGIVPFILTPRQTDLIHSFEDGNHQVVVKYRQAGISTVTAAYIAIKVAFCDLKNPIRVVCIANKRTQAEEILDKIKIFMAQLPKWVWGNAYDYNKEIDGHIIGKGSVQNIKTVNGCRLTAYAASKDAARGVSGVRYLIGDECAHWEKGGEEMFTAAMLSMAANKKAQAILISTPKGFDPVFYKSYVSAVNDAQGFKLMRLEWFQDTRYNRDLEWLYENEEGEKIIEKEIHFDIKEMDVKYKSGWIPSSTWFRQQAAALNNSKKAINRELLCKFEGSAGNVIDYDHINRIKEYEVEEPLVKTDIQNGMWLWEEPIEGNEYIAFIDPSSGTGQDNASLQIINITSMEQAAEFRGDVKGEVLAEIAHRWCTDYNALTSIDVTGGYGDTCVHELKQLDFKLFAKNSDDSIGLKFSGSNRPKIIQNGVSHIENAWIKIKSIRTATEMETFVWVGSKAEHMRGFHDDSLMALFGNLYMLNFHFKQIKSATKLDISILKAWVTGNKKDEIPKMSDRQYNAWEKYVGGNNDFSSLLLQPTKPPIEKLEESETLRKYGMPFISK